MVQASPSLRKGRWRRLIFLTLAAFFFAAPQAQPAVPQEARSIALTFNDLPGRGPFGFWRPREISNLILRTLEKHNAPAAGFVVQEKIEDDRTGLIVLDDWANRGFLLGNQSWGRADYNVLNFEDFWQHVMDGDKTIRALSLRHRIPYRFFRFPQLHQGNTSGKRKDAARALRRADYKVAHVTVKTSDHLFLAAFLAHEREPEAIAKLKALFLGHVSENLDYAERQSEAVFGRSIAQILLLRCTIATATFLDDLLTLLEQRGYSFVTLPEALKDPAYGTPEEYAGPYGLSFIDRVADGKDIPYDETQGDLESGDVERWLEAALKQDDPQ